MADRYSRLFHSDEVVYFESSPVIIEAKALLCDNEADKNIAQIKFKNISPKTVTAVFADITAYDPSGEAVEKISHTYLDLSAERGESFGAQNPAGLGGKTARSFDVTVCKAVFADGSVWENNECERVVIPGQKDLTEHLGNASLSEQYQRRHGNSAKYVPQKISGIWLCACGKINHSAEGECFSCKQSLAALTESLDTEVLTADLYDYAIRLMENNTNEALEEAAESFKSISDWKDSYEKISQCESKINELMARQIKAEKRKKWIAAAVCGAAVLCIALAIVIKQAVEQERIEKRHQKALTILSLLEDNRGSCSNLNYVSVPPNTIRHSELYVMGLKNDGTVVGTDNDNSYNVYNVFGWTDIVAVTSSNYDVFGLRPDGTVVSVGENDFSLDWTDIVDIDGGKDFCVGLKSDGNVVAIGIDYLYQSIISDWIDIVDVAVTDSAIVGLKSSGSIVAAGKKSDWTYAENYENNDFSDWTDIVAVETSNSYIYGLKADGTVKVKYNGEPKECEWTDIVDIDVTDWTVIGLKSDGTAVGVILDDKQSFSDWTDIVAVFCSAGEKFFGLQADGTVIDSFGNVVMTDIKVPYGDQIKE